RTFEFRAFLRALTVPPEVAEGVPLATAPRVVWPNVLTIECVVASIDFQYPSSRSTRRCLSTRPPSPSRRSSKTRCEIHDGLASRFIGGCALVWGFTRWCLSPQLTTRIVSELCHIPPETWGQHQHLRGHVHEHRCCGKSLIGSALVGFRVRQHAPRESISK